MIVNEGASVPSISLCMIVKDEEATLGRCLDSVRHLVDEIIIVDTGSVDRTKEIAAQYTNLVFDFTWIDDFAAARNFSFSKATKDYILWLDADDVLLEADQKKFQDLKKAFPKDADLIAMAYNLAFDKSGKVASSIVRSRLVKRSQQFEWVGKVHESINTRQNSKAYFSDAAVTHKKEKEITGRNLSIYENMLQHNIPLTPHDLFHYAKECLYFGQKEKAASLFEQYLQANPDHASMKIMACIHLADYYFETGDLQSCMNFCLKSLQFGTTPYAEITSRMGNLFLRMQKLEAAIFWSQLSLTLPVPISGQVIDHSSYTWQPHLNLCSCYFNLQNYEKAQEHLQKAYEYAPNEPNVLLYKKEFDRFLKETP